MLQPKKINEIARDVAAANLGANNVVRVHTAETTDAQGQDALRVMIVIPEDAVPRISGDAALATLTEMQRRIGKAGDERFAFVEYATEEELNAVADAEP
jgi:hypothetical protein